MEKEILAAYEGVRAASEVVGTEAQLLLAPRLPVLGWMFKERAPSTHHATDATWSKWVALITQRARIGSPTCPGILEVITDWPEGKDFRMSPEEEVTCAEEAPPYNKLTEDEKPYALFTDGSCRTVGKHQRWKATVWSPTRRVAEAAEGQGESSQFAEVKAIQLALDIAEREKWPMLYLYTESWMVANALWGWLQQWKQSNWQCRGKPIWAAPLWQDIAARLAQLVEYETLNLRVLGSSPTLGAKKDCGWLTLAGGQVPTRANLSLPSFTKQGRKGIRKCLCVEIRTGRDHSLIVVTSKTD
ncbi:hypothetical protein GRJ2_003345900 [Grus japonensis]|uniref:RNase H type-1 domain-containing protein n=1 Tax=Grus japonensis TaxID=30415 RepID=A0ABC9YGV4_GRUJA